MSDFDTLLGKNMESRNDLFLEFNFIEKNDSDCLEKFPKTVPKFSLN